MPGIAHCAMISIAYLHKISFVCITKRLDRSLGKRKIECPVAYAYASGNGNMVLANAMVISRP